MAAGSSGATWWSCLRTKVSTRLPASRTDGDLVDAGQARLLFERARPELVFHLAAEVGGIGANRLHPGRYWYANLLMGANVLEAEPQSWGREARHGRNRLLLPESHSGSVP